MQQADTHIPGGYIRLYRQLLESDLFRKPPHYLKLWVWMLLKARWKDGDGLKRGQLRTCIKDMQAVGQYKSGNRLTGSLTANQVRAAYGWLRQTGAIKVADTISGLTITITNYDTFQAQENPGPQQNPDHTPDHTPDTITEQPKILGIVRDFDQTGEPDPTRDTTPEPARTPHHLKERKKESLVAPPTSKRPPSGDHQLFISWWHYAFEKTQCRAYLFAAKDAKAVKSLLTIHPIKHLVLAACHFLTVDDTFLNNRRDLPMLLSMINRMPGPSDPAHNGGTRYRAAGLLPPEGVKLENWRFYDTTPPPKELNHAD